MRDYDDDRDPMPKPGDLVIMVDGEGYPQFIWRTTEVTIKPLSQVDEAFAWDEGEGTAHETGGSMPIAAISLGKLSDPDLEKRFSHSTQNSGSFQLLKNQSW